jgi:hypothetical protein
VGSGLAVLSGIIALLFIPRLDQECIQEEDIKFRHYLEEHGFDVSKMGLPITKTVDGVEHVVVVGGSSTSAMSEGTATGVEGHASEVPVANAANKGKGWFKRFIGVAP